jgi:hypothetical protein
MVTNINKTNTHLSPQLTEQTTTYKVGNPKKNSDLGHAIPSLRKMELSFVI